MRSAEATRHWPAKRALGGSPSGVVFSTGRPRIFTAEEIDAPAVMVEKHQQQFDADDHCGHQEDHSRHQRLAGPVEHQQDAGDGLEHVVEPLQEVVHLAADEAGEHAEEPVQRMAELIARRYGDPLSVKEIAAASDHSLALTEDGKVYGWGMNAQGQLGMGNTNAKTGKCPNFEPEEDGDPDDDVLPLAPPSRCGLGDLWALGRHLLVIGDTWLADLLPLLAGTARVTAIDTHNVEIRGNADEVTPLRVNRKSDQLGVLKCFPFHWLRA